MLGDPGPRECSEPTYRAGPGVDATGFDRFARDYEANLAMGLRLSGESSSYFAQGRVEALSAHLRRRPIGSARAVLDFGCGTGSTTPLLKHMRGVDRVTGVDVSRRLLELARAKHAAAGIQFISRDQLPENEFDIAYCNGVFHHISPGDRLESAERIRSALRPGGLLALCENNPWNVGTRLVMRAIPFDKDAMPISPPNARRLLRESGFRLEGTDFLFFFPRQLRALRRWETDLIRVPLGAQYVLFARKPAAAL